MAEDDHNARTGVLCAPKLNGSYRMLVNCAALPRRRLQGECDYMLRLHVHVMPSGSLVVVLSRDTGVAPISIENRCSDPANVLQARILYAKRERMKP